MRPTPKPSFLLSEVDTPTGAYSKWSRLEARGHHSMARKHPTFLPSPLMEVTLVSVLFKRLIRSSRSPASTTPTHTYHPHRQWDLNITLESILTF